MNHEAPLSRVPAAPGRLRALAFVVPALLAFAPLSAAASEATSLCRQIEQRLAAAAPQPRQDTKALDRAVRQSRAAGCGPMGFSSPHDTHCRVHAQRIHDLQSFAFVPGDFGRDRLRRERARLTAALRVNGCIGRQPARNQMVETAGRGQVATLNRVGAPILTVDGSTPVPTPRPSSPAEVYHARYVELGKSRIAALDIARGEELARPRPISPEREAVRVVGGRFLAEPDGEMDFRAIAYRGENPANGMLAGLLAVIEGIVVSSAVAAER